VLPFAQYERTFHTASERTKFRRLMKRADHVETLDRIGSDEESYFRAGRRVVDDSDLLIAVWDGRPAQGLGGTGDIVTYAEQQGRSTLVIDVARWR
jgi:hypothetical protein